MGLGPCGELRYPAYPESNGTWKFPGIGEFQCYDKVSLTPIQIIQPLDGRSIILSTLIYLNGGPMFVKKIIIINYIKLTTLQYNQTKHNLVKPARSSGLIEFGLINCIYYFMSNLASKPKQYMRASLKASAEASGNEDWGRSGPHDSGQYNQFPEDTGFFRRDGTWNSEYGRFFMEWYSGKLIQHGDRILAAAKEIFQGTGSKLSGKVAGIHWHYRSRSHAAELTAGYYNTRYRDGYIPIARMLAKHGVILNFTCMEMRDTEQPGNANCSPEGLVRQVKMATRTAGVELAGENALERYDADAYAQVLATSNLDAGNGLSAFTYLRMNKKLFESDNWRNLVEFVQRMSSEGRRPRLPEWDSTGSDLCVGFVKGKNGTKTKEAALV